MSLKVAARSHARRVLGGPRRLVTERIVVVAKEALQRPSLASVLALGETKLNAGDDDEVAEVFVMLKARE